jgi:hypothetical protein
MVAELFVYWLYLVVTAYVVLLIVVAVRRIRLGKQTSERGTAMVRAEGTTVEARHGADPGTLSGLFVIAASLLGTTVSLGIGLGAIDTLTGLPPGALFSGPGIFMMVFIGLALVALCWSAWLGIGRWGVLVDGSARTVLTWWGLFVPLCRTLRRLDEFSAVAIRTGKPKPFSRARTFTIRLEGLCRPVLIDGTTCTTPEQARELAQRIAAVSGLKVTDQSN